MFFTIHAINFWNKCSYCIYTVYPKIFVRNLKKSSPRANPSPFLGVIFGMNTAVREWLWLNVVDTNKCIKSTHKKPVPNGHTPGGWTELNLLVVFLPCPHKHQGTQGEEFLLLDKQVPPPVKQEEVP